MKVEQSIWLQEKGWNNLNPTLNQADLVLVFGSRTALLRDDLLETIKNFSSKERILFSSFDSEVFAENEIVFSVLLLNSSTLGSLRGIISI